MDNFEWAYGYDRRFGIIRIDYDTLERTWKDSAHWYRDTIAEHRGSP
jgi:beta-glucosidase